jgi:uncharacterized protein (TIGR02996 family)
MDSQRDEQFVTQLVASPGDDAVRLVYADWLEDHDDARAAYLRAELAWAAKRGRRAEAKVRKLAGTLDAVWVARVSRPPLGVCADHVRFEKSKPVRSAADLDAVETRLEAQLPPDYRAFLLNYNGGIPDPGHIPDPRHLFGPRCLCVGYFFGSTDGKVSGDVEDELREMRNIYRMYLHHHPKLTFPAEGMLPVCMTPDDVGCLLVGITPSNFGRVFHFTDWARSMTYDDAMAELVPSFADLLGRLGPKVRD